jgi:L-asparaginase
MGTHDQYKVAILSLGGTIASTPSAGKDGVIPNLTAKDLVASVPELASIGSIYAEAFLAKPSTELTFSDIASVCKRAGELVDAEGFDGVVVTQGTDSMEETSFVADLLWSSAAPLVFTGAMRNPSLAGPDGPGNLLTAVLTASSRRARNQGVLVVMNDEIHAARNVKKTNTSSPAAFSSAPTGPIGFVTEKHVSIKAKVDRWPRLATPESWNPDVEVVTSKIDGSARLLESLNQDLPAGVVLAGFGGGHVVTRDVPLIESLAKRIPVLLASRTGSGRVLETTYGFPGSEIDLLGRGVIHAGDLHPLKVRILLTVMVSLGWSRDRIATQVAEFGVVASGDVS